MHTAMKGPGFSFRYELVDLRELDGEALLESPNVGDKILAVVTRLRDKKDAIKEIVAKLSSLENTQRDVAFVN